jgi:hypothetical protein
VRVAFHGGAGIDLQINAILISKYILGCFIFIFTDIGIREPGSSGNIVSGYGLDDRAIEVRSPAEAKGFSCSLCVQTGSGAHPASCTMGTGGPFPGAKLRSGRDANRRGRE